MGSVQLNGSGLVVSLSQNHILSHKTKLGNPKSSFLRSKHNASRAKTIRAISTAPGSQPPVADEPNDEPPAVDFAFVHVSSDLHSLVALFHFIFGFDSLMP